jgi:hypothetical protein
VRGVKRDLQTAVADGGALLGRGAIHAEQADSVERYRARGDPRARVKRLLLADVDRGALVIGRAGHRTQ